MVWLITPNIAKAEDEFDWSSLDALIEAAEADDRTTYGPDRSDQSGQSGQSSQSYQQPGRATSNDLNRLPDGSVPTPKNSKKDNSGLYGLLGLGDSVDDLLNESTGALMGVGMMQDGGGGPDGSGGPGGDPIPELPDVTFPEP